MAQNFKQTLKRISGTIKSAMQELLARGKDERAGWVAVGEALLEARGQFPDAPLHFGAWIKGEGISSIPGLATASSRSDCIWMAEFPLCAALVPVAISNPRAVRAAWRLLLVKSAKDWAGAGVSFATAVHHVMNETFCTEAEAEGAVGYATSQALDLLPHPPTPAVGKVAALRKALERAKKGGLNPAQVIEVASLVYQQGVFSWAMEAVSMHIPHPWTPPADYDTPELRFEHAIRMALVDGMQPLDVDGLVPTVAYFNYEEAAERARRALEFAKEKAFDLEEAKAMVKDVYLGDF